jgi:hypothetical protein
MEVGYQFRVPAAIGPNIQSLGSMGSKSDLDIVGHKK